MLYTRKLTLAPLRLRRLLMASLVYAAPGRLYSIARSIQQTSATSGKSSTEIAAPCPPGTVCVQWAWDDTETSSSSSNSARGSTSRPPVLGVDNVSDGEGDNIIMTGLFPTRTAFILLGPPRPAEDSEGPPGGAEDGGVSCPSITLSRMLARRAHGLRRRASQLKVRITFQDEVQ